MTVDLIDFASKIGIPGTIAIALVVLAYRGLQAYRDDRRTQRDAKALDADREKRETEREAERDRRDDERQQRLFQFLQTSIEQNTLLRDTLEKQNERFVRALEAQTAQIAGMQTAFLAGLGDTFTKAQADRKQITTDVNAHTDDTLRGVEARIATHVDDGLRLVQVSTDALAAGIEVQHQDNRAALAAVADAHAARDAESAKTADELRKVAALVENAGRVSDERTQAVVSEILKAITPRLDEIAQTLRVVLERVTPPATLPEPLPSVAPAAVVADAPRDAGEAGA